MACVYLHNQTADAILEQEANIDNDVNYDNDDNVVIGMNDRGKTVRDVIAQANF